MDWSTAAIVAAVIIAPPPPPGLVAVTDRLGSRFRKD